MTATPRLVKLTVGVGDEPALSAYAGLRASLPAGLLERDEARHAVAGGEMRPRERIEWRLSGSERRAIVDGMRLRAAFTSPPASSRLPISYRYVPARLRMMIARFIGRRKRASRDEWADYPDFPLDLSADLAADLLGTSTRRVPSGAPAPVVLSHDLDSPEGLSSFLRRFAPIEEAAGARSTCFCVPCAWTLDHGQLTELTDRDHELGIHGYDHANVTPFAEPEKRRRRLDAARPLIERYDCVGYRAPSLLRTPELLADLAERYGYDASMPASGGLFPVPNNGCATARPFAVCGIAELPLSMPRDGSLRFLGYRPSEIASLWIDCASRIAGAGGVVVLLTHCERHFSGNRSMLDAYRRFVEFIASDDRFVFRRARDVMSEAAL